jgi:2'-5' RNA ligase
MHRLFVAIRPPAAVRAALIARMGGVAGARWQDDDQLHITLRFIGPVDRPTAEDIAVALTSVRQTPFDIALSGVGSFDRKGRPDALWVGVTLTDAIHALHKKIDQAIVRLGLPAEGRAYLPHVTIARLGRTAGPVGGFIDHAGTIGSAPFTITHFALFESTLGQGGAVYTAVERYPLG